MKQPNIFFAPAGFIRRTPAVLVLLFVLLGLPAFRIPASAALPRIVIDGRMDATEWYGAEGLPLFSSAAQSGNHLSYAYMKYIISPEEDAICLCVTVIGTDITADTLRAGVRVTLNGGAPAEVTADGLLSYDAEALRLEAALKIDQQNGFTAELRVGLKRALPSTISLGLQLLDGAGEPSRLLTLPLQNPAYTTAESSTSPKPSAGTTKATKETTTRKETTGSTAVGSITTQKPQTTVKQAGQTAAGGNRPAHSPAEAPSEETFPGGTPMDTQSLDTPVVPAAETKTVPGENSGTGQWKRILAAAGAFLLLAAAAGFGIFGFGDKRHKNDISQGAAPPEQ